VARWLQTLAQRGGAVRDDARRQQAAAAYAGPGGALPLCQDVVQRFPFRPTAKDDVAVNDFAELFAPGGRFDAFYGQFVRPYVDSSGKDWKLKDPFNPQIPFAADAVAQFQRAQVLRDTFFGFGGTQPQVHFALRPGPLDAGASQVTLDFGGIAVAWRPDSQGGTQILDWPGPTRMTSVSVMFQPLVGEARQSGPWALFRFLKETRLEKSGGGESYTVTVRQGERQAQFELSASSSHSPFDAELFSKFKCPSLRP
jgi:type VI secretion system protein ImpL